MDNIKQLVTSCEAAISGKARMDDIERIMSCLLRQAPQYTIDALRNHAWARVKRASPDGDPLVNAMDRALPFAALMTQVSKAAEDIPSILAGPPSS